MWLARLADAAVARPERLRRVLRWPLRFAPPSLPVPIIEGPLRGAWWRLGAGSPGQALGTYEAHKARRFADAIPRGAVVYDIGAHAGWYTLLAARRAGPTGRVVAFEPVAANVANLKAHLRLNRLTTVTVIAAAVTDQDGAVAFADGPRTFNGAPSFMGRVAAAGRHVVPAVQLDTLLTRHALPPPTLLKIDVEGGELGVLSGAQRLLVRHRPAIFLATHSPLLDAACRVWLCQRRYRLETVNPVDRWGFGELLAHPA